MVLTFERDMLKNWATCPLECRTLWIYQILPGGVI